MSLLVKNPWTPILDPEQIRLDILQKNGENILLVVDTLGTCCRPVRSDMSGNLNKIADAHQKLCPEAEFLHELLAKEFAAGSHKKDPSATVGFLWLTRGLMYLLRVLQYVIEEKDDSNDSCQPVLCKSYNDTLRQHHNIVMRGAFSAVSYAAPKKSVVFQRLTENGETKKETLYEDMQTYIDAMAPTVDAYNKLLTNLGIN